MATVARQLDQGHGGDDFLGWLDSEFIRVVARQKHGQWYARAEDFGIVGIGSTEGDAVREVTQLTQAYLQSYFEDGLTYKDAWRPGRRRSRLWNILLGLVARGLHAIGRRPSFSEEDRVLLPVAFHTTNT